MQGELNLDNIRQFSFVPSAELQNVYEIGFHDSSGMLVIASVTAELLDALSEAIKKERG